MPIVAEVLRRGFAVGPLALGLLTAALIDTAGCSSDAGQVSPPPEPPGGLCASEAAGGQPIRLSEDAASLVSQRASGAGAPRAAADAAGTRLIVYRDDIPTGAGDVVVRRAGGGGTFGAPQGLSGTRAESAAPDVALAGQLAVVVWAEVDGDAPGLYARISNDAGQTFQPPVRVSGDAGPETRPRVAIDDGGRIVALWDGVSRPSQVSLFPVRSLRLARSTDGGRSFAEAPVLAEIQGVGQPALAVGPSGRVFAVWAQQRTIEAGHALMLVRSDPGGGTFEAPAFIADEVTAGAALAVDPAGRLFVFWMPGTTARGAWEPEGVGLLRSSNDGMTFTDLGLLDTAPASGVWLASGVDSLSMVWTSCPTATACTSRFSVSTDGGVTRSLAMELTRPGSGGAPLALSAVAGAAPPAMLLVWEEQGWFRDLLSETFNPAGPVAPPAPLTVHGSISPAAVGAAASAPVVVVPGDGRIVAAWSQDANSVPSDHAGIFVARSADEGGTFSPPLRIATNLPSVDFACMLANPDKLVTPTQPRVSLATRGASEIVLAWVDDVVDPAWQGACWLANRPDVFVSRSIDGGQSFSAPLNVSRGAGYSENPLLAYDARGGLTLLWQERVEERLAGCSYSSRSQIVAARSQDGGATFSAPVGVSEQAVPGFCGNASDPVLAVANDSLFAGWIAQSAAGVGNTAVVVTRSVDGGASFSAGRSVVDVPYADGLISALAARANQAGDLWLVWRIGNALRVSHSSDGAQTFASPSPIAELSASDGIGLDLLGGATGAAWVTWADPGAVEAAREVRAARLGANAASIATFNISKNAGDSDWPSVAADRAGNALIVWQDDTSTPGNPGVLIGCQRAEP